MPLFDTGFSELFDEFFPEDRPAPRESRPGDIANNPHAPAQFRQEDARVNNVDLQYDAQGNAVERPIPPVRQGLEPNNQVFRPGAEGKGAIIKEPNQNEMLVAPPEVGKQLKPSYAGADRENNQELKPELLNAIPGSIGKELESFKPGGYEPGPWAQRMYSAVHSYPYSALTANLGFGALQGAGSFGSNLAQTWWNAPTHSEQMSQNFAIANNPNQNLSSSPSGRVDTTMSAKNRQAEVEDQLVNKNDVYWYQQMPQLLGSTLPLASSLGLYGAAKGLQKGTEGYYDYIESKNEAAAKKIADVNYPEHVIKQKENVKVINQVNPNTEVNLKKPEEMGNALGQPPQQPLVQPGQPPQQPLVQPGQPPQQPLVQPGQPPQQPLVQPGQPEDPANKGVNANA